jgi:uncharacterized repeat protein (TIGR01451 family)
MKKLLMPATPLAAIKKMAFAILCVSLLVLAAAPAWAQTQDQCFGALPLTNPGPNNPGTVTGCGALITVTGVDGNGNATFFTVMNVGNHNPYDGTEDTLVGVQNNSGAELNSITLSSTTSQIFGFDNDGPCTQTPHSSGCPFPGTTGYEGPNNTFSALSDDLMTGTVNFTTPIPSLCESTFCNSTWFALEGTPDSLTTVSQTQPTPPGVTTLFDFGPFNWKSTPAATTQNGNSLTITAIPLAPGTVINFADHTHGNCITYSNTGGNCRAFDIKCNGPNCDASTYFAEFSSAYDVDHNIHFPGLAKGEPDCSIIPNISNTTFTNQIDFFSQTSKDPTTKGRSGGTGSCWIAVENVNYPNADVSIVKVAPPLVKSGGTLPYGIAVLNLGGGTATAVTVTDPVPSGTTFQSSAVCFTGSSGVTCQSGANSPCVLSAGVVTCTLGNLVPFSLRTLAAIGIQLNFTVNAASGQIITNTAAVSAFNPDPRTGNNTSTAKSKVCSNIVGLKCIP